MYKKILLPVFLICILSTMGYGSDLLFDLPADPPDTLPKIPKYVVGNWNNVMDPKGCVLLDEDNNLKIKAIITFAVDDLAPFEDMFLYSEFTGQSLTNHGQIFSDALVPTYLPNGDLVYIYAYEVFNNKFTTECELDPENPISFDYHISVRDENGDLYPIDLYYEAIVPEAIYDPEGDGNYIIPTVVYEGNHDLCCYISEEGTEGFVSNTPASINAHIQHTTDNNDAGLISKEETKASILSPVLSPNPFDESVLIEFQTQETEMIMIQIWNVNGSLVRFKEYLPDTSGYQQVKLETNMLQDGLYYFTIKSNSLSETFKILKIKR